MQILSCPGCSLPLSKIIRNSIEADICRHCRGIWLGFEAYEKFATPVSGYWQEDKVCPEKQYQEFFTTEPTLEISENNQSTAFDCLRALKYM